MRMDSSEEEKAILRNVLFFLRSWNPRSRISPPGIRSRRSESGILSRLRGIIENWDDQIPAVEAPRVLRAFFFMKMSRDISIFSPTFVQTLSNVQPRIEEAAIRCIVEETRKESFSGLPSGCERKNPTVDGRNERDVIHPPRSVLVRADGSPDKAPCIVFLSKPEGHALPPPIPIVTRLL